MTQTNSFYDTLPRKVLLPKWIWEEAKSKEHFKTLVLQYMSRYQDYSVKSVENQFAICVRELI